MPFGPKEFLVWVQWYFLAILAGIAYMPVLLLTSPFKVLRFNHMFVIFWATLGIDFYLKRLFSDLLANGKSIPVIDGFLTFTLVHNKGAAFGLFAGWTWLFVSMAVLTGIFILIYLALYRLEDKLICWALVLILSGAIGNMIDRIQFNYVVDYILVYYRDYRWPVFNFADIIINTGVGIIIFDTIRDFFRGSSVEPEPLS